MNRTDQRLDFDRNDSLIHDGYFANSPLRPITCGLSSRKRLGIEPLLENITLSGKAFRTSERHGTGLDLDQNRSDRIVSDSHLCFSPKIRSDPNGFSSEECEKVRQAEVNGLPSYCHLQRGIDTAEINCKPRAYPAFLLSNYSK